MTMVRNAERLALEVLANALDPFTAKATMVADLRTELNDITEELSLLNRRSAKEVARLQWRQDALADRITAITALFNN